MTVRPRTFDDRRDGSVQELFFGRTAGIAGRHRVTLRVSYDGVAPVMMIGGSTEWITPRDARKIAGALLQAAFLADVQTEVWLPDSRQIER